MWPSRTGSSNASAATAGHSSGAGGEAVRTALTFEILNRYVRVIGIGSSWLGILDESLLVKN